MTEENLAIADFKLTTDVGEIYFNTFAELEAWARKEREVFRWVVETNNLNLTELTQSYNSFYTTLINQSVSTPRSKNDKEERCGNILASSNSFFNVQNGVTSESPVGQYIIAQYKLHGAVSAAWSLYTITWPQRASGQQRSPATMDAVKGVYRGLDYEKGSSDSAESIQKSLELMKKRWESNFQEKNEQAASDLEKFNDDANKRLGDIEGHEELVISSEEERQNVFDKFVGSCVGEHASIVELFKTTMSLNAPVTYWKSKAKRHLITMGISGGSALIVASILLVFIFQNAFITPDLISGFSDVAESLDVPADAKPSDYFQLGKLIFLISFSTVLIWLIRLLTRVFIANMHLRDDALERVTMMEAFLSLVEYTDSLSPSDIHLALGALFRPASSGLIKDDGVNSPIEVIVNKAMPQGK